MSLPKRVGEVVGRVWGFSSLRPLQEQAILGTLERRDSLVVMPTGGGKSLCYQVPPLVSGDLTVVVSPLISLMKDQVDSLREVGVAASQIDSTTSEADKRRVAREAREGSLRLLFVSPERLGMDRFVSFLEEIGVARFAIDEAHCISHWGHDFRPDYRLLASLRVRFPDASMHAFTATATTRVRADIAAQLELRDPDILVGDFDRPNLVYRVLPRRDRLAQVLQVIRRHEREGGIVYCMRRRDVDELSEALRREGVNARAYHAGLTQDERRDAQDAFAGETCDVIVATVAFGMGIDRSNIRYVVHAGLPKSIEHYQQETGRAGRDGLDSECVLLYSGGDVPLWKSIFARAGEEVAVAPEVREAAERHLEEMNRYARGSVCRHRALVRYFDQEYDLADCRACDLCLGETLALADGPVIAQKILSAVARTKERFGIGYVVNVLRGEPGERIVANQHDKLSVFGLLDDCTDADLRDWIRQLIGQGLLEQDGGEYPVLKLNASSWEVLRGERSARLVQIARPAKKERKRAAKFADASWEGVDQALFEKLRLMRGAIAKERHVPAYVVFGDVTLRELARRRPLSLGEIGTIHGIGEAKLRDLAPRFLEVIVAHEGE
ncbi:MAG: DNA helicase RecQ [Thermoanaerobaculia bacterium]